MADVVFDSYSFAATGSTAVRTMPARLNDIVNVKDWGAKGDGLADDSGAFQSAVNFTISNSSGGLIFVPPGAYKFNSILAVGSASSTARVIFKGSGQQFGCRISATSTGFVVSQSTATFDNLQSWEGIDIVNGSTVTGSGCIRVTNSVCSVRNSYFSGMVLVDASQASGCSITDIAGNGNDLSGGAGSTNAIPANGIGFLLGSNCIAENCRNQGSTWLHYALSGQGAACVACSGEVGTIAARLGWGWLSSLATYGEVPAIGCIVQGLQVEDCNTGVELYNAQGCAVYDNWFFGHVSVTQGNNQTIANATYNGVSSSVLVTIATPHNISSATSSQPFVVSINPSIYTPADFSYITWVSSLTFSYPLSPSSAPSAFVNGNWNYPLQYTIRCRTVSECVIMNNLLAYSPVAIAEIDLDYNGDSNTVQASNVMMSIGNFTGGGGWRAPSATKNLAGWQFIQCGNTNYNSSVVNSVGTLTNFIGQMSFKDLPGQFSDPTGIYQPGPIEGQEYTIKDSSIASSGNFAAIISSGAGTFHAKVRYDGTNWRITG